MRLCSSDPPGDLGVASEAIAWRRVATEGQGGSALRLNCGAMPCDSLGRESEVGVGWGCSSCEAMAGVDSVIGNRNYGFGSRSSLVTTDGWSLHFGRSSSIINTEKGLCPIDERTLGCGYSSSKKSQIEA